MSTNQNQNRSVKVASLIKDALEKIDLRSSTVAATVVTEQDTLTGLCSGDLRVSISVDDVTGAFTGSVTFNGFSDVCGESISGTMSFSGQVNLAAVNPDDPLFLSYQVNTTALVVNDGSDSFTITGQINFSFPSASEIDAVENFDIGDSTGKVFRVSNYSVAITDIGSGTSQVLINGRFYHPDFGYVDVTTTLSFAVPDGSEFPISGSLRIDGALGTQAVLTANNDGTYQLQIDADHDATFETTQTGNWVDL